MTPTFKDHNLTRQNISKLSRCYSTKERLAANYQQLYYQLHQHTQLTNYTLTFSTAITIQ